jgi:XTP/dITP diphosphohydrolase
VKLVLATQNPHKVAEIGQILQFPGLDVVGLSDYPRIPPVNEDGESLEENAIKKARTVAEITGEWALSDDSGLEVAALGGAPGVRSARYAGEPSNHRNNTLKLLAEMTGMEDRRARFRCVIALSNPSGGTETVEGICEGEIACECRGEGGFGYDPIFVPVGHNVTFAEMSAADKNRLSHRGRALAAAGKVWGKSIFCRSGS